MAAARTRSGSPKRGRSRSEREKAFDLPVPDDKIEREIWLPDGTFKTFRVSKGPLHDLAGPEIQEALSKMPNGGRLGGAPISPKFAAAAAAAKVYGVPPKGITVEAWKSMTATERSEKRAEDRERRKIAKVSMSPEQKKAKQKRRRSAKLGASKVKRVNSRHARSMAAVGDA
jgi:hypothetical protein